MDIICESGTKYVEEGLGGAFPSLSHLPLFEPSLPTFPGFPLFPEVPSVPEVPACAINAQLPLNGGVGIPVLPLNEI